MCGGDIATVKWVLMAYNTFSAVSVLKMNKEKTSLYITGVDKVTMNSICKLTGVTMGKLPFRYLGVSIYLKKLRTGECNKIVERMVTRIRGWESQHLSYAGRLVLIKDVLIQVQSYWMRIFLLPKNVLY